MRHVKTLSSNTLKNSMKKGGCGECLREERNPQQEESKMKHVKTLNKANLKETAAKGGCGECQTSCQSACKTSCTVGNQSCENSNR